MIFQKFYHQLYFGNSGAQLSQRQQSGDDRMHSDYFVLKNREGKQAEQLVKDFLTNRGYAVQDVSEDCDNYQNDVDFIVQKDRRTSKIEVKLDTRLKEKGLLSIISYQ